MQSGNLKVEQPQVAQTIITKAEEMLSYLRARYKKEIMASFEKALLAPNQADTHQEPLNSLLRRLGITQANFGVLAREIGNLRKIQSDAYTPVISIAVDELTDVRIVDFVRSLLASKGDWDRQGEVARTASLTLELIERERGTQEFTIKSNFPRARLRLYTGNLVRVPDGVTEEFIETEVEVLEETAEFFRVKYRELFKLEHPDRCTDTVGKKERWRKVTYKNFQATYDKNERAEGIAATYAIKWMRSTKHGLEIGRERANVIIVEETDDHYRLQFEAEFAEHFPELCHEWVRKDCADPRVSRKK